MCGDGGCASGDHHQLQHTTNLLPAPSGRPHSPPPKPQPTPPLAVGAAAGLLSVFGYETVSPALESRCGLTDTCGVANLHGMPGILGGLASALFAWLYYTPANAKLIAHGNSQPGFQLMGLGATVAIAAAAGLAGGFVVSRVGVAGQALEVDKMYEDAVFWHEVEEEDE